LNSENHHILHLLLFFALLGQLNASENSWLFAIGPKTLQICSKKIKEIAYLRNKELFK